MTGRVSLREDNGRRLSWREVLSFGGGSVASNLSWNMVAGFLIVYYTDVAFLPAAVVGTIILLTRIFDAVVDPAVGLLVDRTHTRLGKARPYVLFAAVPFALLCILTFDVPHATDGTVLGPYYAPNAPARENGASVIDTDDGGARLRLRGTVRSLDGWPLAGALVDVWSCASNGLYPAQDPLQAPTNLRGLFRTNGRGQYEFMTLRPTNYSVPTDGPVGKLLQVNARSPMRAAHIHLIVSATGYQTVITHLFDSVSPYLQGDAVFSVRPSLVRNLEKLDENIWAAEFDIALALR